jgi:hypothetical protein
MRRRHFIQLLGGAAVWPTAAHAQISAKRPLVAVLSGVTREGYARVSAFERGMLELGYVEGRNIDIEYRFADGWLERLPGLAEELVRLSPKSGARHPPYVLNVPRGGSLCEALRSPNARGRSIFGRGKRGERSIVPGALRRRLERPIRMHAKRKSGAEQQ